MGIAQTVQDILLDLYTSFTSFIPNFITGLVIILIGWVISRIVRWIVMRVAKTAGLDRAADKMGITEGLATANVKQTPSELLAIVLYWYIFLSFILEGFRAMQLGELLQPIQSLIEFLPVGIVSVVLLVLGVMFARFAGNTVSGATEAIGIEFHESLGTLVRSLIVAFVVIIVMEQIGLDTSIISTILSSTITIVIAGLALAFGLGGRTVTRNVLAGFYARELFEPGDIIEIDGEEGILEGIGTLNSELRVGRDRLTIPNTRLTEGSVKRREDDLLGLVDDSSTPLV
jgi:hypothetical protein